MPDAIREYQQKLAELEAATGRAERVRDIVVGAGRALGDGGWKRTMVANSGGFPAHIALDRTVPTIDARQWPTAQQLCDVLSAYHLALAAAKNAWEALPLTDRRGLNPPPR